MDSVSRNAVVDIISLLVAGDYKGIELVSNGINVKANELEAAVRDYGRTLVMPDAEHLLIDEVRVNGRVPPTWSVTCTLWTKEEGRSDLSLELTVIRRADRAVIEVDGLHVL